MNRILTLTIAGLTLASCASHTDHVASVDAFGRTPASAFQNKDMPDLTDPAAVEFELNNLLNQYMRVFYVSQSNLQEFDEHLDSATEENSALNDPSYSRLLAGHELSIAIRERIGDHYARILKTSLNSNGHVDPNSRDVASRLLVSFHRRLAAMSGADALALVNLGRSLKAIQGDNGEKMANFLKGLQLTGNEVDLNNIIPKTIDELRTLVRDSRGDLARNAGESRQIKDGLLEQLDTRGREIRGAGEDPSERTPQSLKIFPSMSSNGSISGDNFPTGAWALTYDDGPSISYTPLALANLAKHNVKATFFWLAQNVVAHPGIVAQVRAAGMPTENHSYSHPDLSKASEAGLVHEIDVATQKETAVYGEAPKFFRCPYGAGFATARVRSHIVANHMVHVFWNVDSLDWQDHNPDSILARVQKQMHAAHHGIILFHDIHPQSIVASNKVMDWVAETNKTAPAASRLRLVTIPQIVDEINGVTPALPAASNSTAAPAHPAPASTSTKSETL